MEQKTEEEQKIEQRKLIQQGSRTVKKKESMKYTIINIK